MMFGFDTVIVQKRAKLSSPPKKQNRSAKLSGHLLPDLD